MVPCDLDLPLGPTQPHPQEMIWVSSARPRVIPTTMMTGASCSNRQFVTVTIVFDTTWKDAAVKPNWWV
jgi:hypothetical protein